MSALDLVRLALGRLGASRMRTLLTMLGIIIGVASVVSLVAVGQGATSGITTRLEGLGTNLLTVNPGSSFSGATRGAFGSATTLTLDDAERHRPPRGRRRRRAGAHHAAARRGRRREHDDQHPGHHRRLRRRPQRDDLAGHLPDRPGGRARPAGRRPRRIHGRRRWASAPSAIGSDVSIGGIPFRVVGILQPKGGTGFLDQDDKILVPVGAVRDHFVGGDSVRSIAVSVADADEIDLAKARITRPSRSATASPAARQTTSASSTRRSCSRRSSR